MDNCSTPGMTSSEMAAAAGKTRAPIIEQADDVGIGDAAARRLAGGKNAEIDMPVTAIADRMHALKQLEARTIRRRRDLTGPACTLAAPVVQ